MYGKTGWSGLCAVALLCAGFEAQGSSSFGGRVWYADYDQTFEREGESKYTVEGGQDPMYMVQYSSVAESGATLAVMLGYGKGWDESEAEGDFGADVTIQRFDGLVGVSQRIEQFALGIGFHMFIVDHDFDYTDTTREWSDTYAFMSLEFLAGASIEVIPERLVLNASATVMAPTLAMLTATYGEQGDIPEDDASSVDVTWGYGADVGALLSLGSWAIGGGYRYQEIAEYDYTLEFDDSTVKGSHGDEFGGFYVAALYGW